MLRQTTDFEKYILKSVFFSRLAGAFHSVEWLLFAVQITVSAIFLSLY